MMNPMMKTTALAGLSLVLMAAPVPGQSGPATTADVLDTLSIMASAMIEETKIRAVALHAVAEDFVHDPGPDVQAAARAALERTLDQYLRAELVALFLPGELADTPETVEESLFCLAPDAFRTGIAAVVEDPAAFPDIDAASLDQARPGSWFGVLHTLLIDTGTWSRIAKGRADDGTPAREGAYMLAAVEALQMELERLSAGWSNGGMADRLTSGDPSANLATVCRAVVRQAGRNRLLLGRPDCADTRDAARIIRENTAGLQALWIGQFSGQGPNQVVGPGLSADPGLSSAGMADSMRLLYNTALMTLDERYRDDFEEHYPVFLREASGRLSRWLTRQAEAWGAAALALAPE